MHKRLTPIEKLAREICWREFIVPLKKWVGKTKAAYWRDLSEEKRRECIDDAMWWLAMYRRLPVDLINEAEARIAAAGLVEVPVIGKPEGSGE